VTVKPDGKGGVALEKSSLPVPAAATA
jgi:hypothetical protein